MKRLMLTAAIMIFVSSPVFAGPWDDNFNNNATTSSLWEHVYTETDPATFTVQNDRMEWYINGKEMGEMNITYITDKYVSQWQYDLSDDVTFKVDYLYRVSNGTGTGTGMNLGVYYGSMSTGDPDFLSSIGVKYTIDPNYNNGTIFPTYNWAVAGDNITGASNFFGRADINGTGVLSINYLEDQRRLQLYGSSGPMINVTLPADVTSLGVYMEGWASGGTTIRHDAPSYFDNFTAAPEPVSCILFLTGGALLIARRRNRGQVH